MPDNRRKRVLLIAIGHTFFIAGHPAAESRQLGTPESRTGGRSPVFRPCRRKRSGLPWVHRPAIQSLGADRAGHAPTQPRAKAKGGKKASPKPKAATARDASKKATVIALLNRKDGATLEAIMKATDWQAHCVRGFISGALIKKGGLKVESFNRNDGERAYATRG